ncbi:MAG: Crp/Fnr family transcriptional regulator, partial [Fibrobacterales bacterium]
MNFISDILHLDPEKNSTDFILAQSALTTRSVKKGEVLVREGECATKVFFVKKGLLRAYSLDDNGKEHIFLFAPEGWIVSDGEAVTAEAPSNLSIDAIEDSELDVIDKVILQDVILSTQGTEELLLNLRRRIAVLQKRVIMLMSSPVVERYKDFIKTYPDIIQRAPQRMIASYLGVTPEALS